MKSGYLSIRRAIEDKPTVGSLNNTTGVFEDCIGTGCCKFSHYGIDPVKIHTVPSLAPSNLPGLPELSFRLREM